MSEFILGFLLGTLATGVAAAVLFKWITAPAIAAILNEKDLVLKRLGVARKRLGLIANRQSIGEARRIANETLKELSE